MIHIIKKIPVISDNLIRAFSMHTSATVHEAMGRRGAINSSIKPLVPGMKVCGPAITVTCHAADNLMLARAIKLARPGEVIVADMGGILEAGGFGELLAVECVTKKVAGIVISGSVRDSREIIALGLSVFSAGISISGTAKATLGSINHPISCGDVIVNPGDIILGDNDGIVVIPNNEAENALTAADARVEKENKVKDRLRAGESLFDIYGYQKILDALGCVEEEE